MIKNYEHWHNIKTRVNDSEDARPFFHEEEIWLCRLGAKSVAILSQLKLIDAKRLSNKIGDISKRNFLLLKEKLKAIMP